MTMRGRRTRTFDVGPDARRRLESDRDVEWVMHGGNGKRAAASCEEIRLVGGMAGVVAVTLVLLALQL